MNAREIFRNIMDFVPVDKIPVLALEPYEQPVIERWHKEGLPIDQSPEQFLTMDYLDKMRFRFGPMPQFESRRISETDKEYVETDWLA